MISGVVCIVQYIIGCVIFGLLFDADLICIELRMVAGDEYECSIMSKV